MLRPTILTALLLTLPLLLNGCGGGDSGGSANTANAGGSGGSDEMVRYTASRSQVRHMDPIQISDVTSAAVAGNIFDTLYQYHYLKTGELIPSLAAEMPQTNEDRTVYTIKLRDDVYFHDDPAFPNGEGRKLVAGDIVYSWKRLADVNNAAGNWSFLDGRIKGLDEFREYTKDAGDEVDYSRTVEGLQAVDDHTLRIELTEASPQFRYVLAHLPTAAVPREAVEHYGEEFINHPVGTGAYMLKEWRRGSKITLVKNPDYRDERYPSEGPQEAKEAGLLADAGKKLPFIDRIEISIIEEGQPYWLTFMDGKIDSASIPKDSFDQAISGGVQNAELSPQMKEKGVSLHTIRDPSTFWLGFNMEDPVVGENLPLRRAMSLAIDREDYIDLLRNGRGEPAHGFFPPAFEVYNEDLESPYTQHDPEKAKELLKKAREVHGGELPTLELYVPGTDPTMRQHGTFLRRAWENIGLKVSTQHMDWPTFQRTVDNKSAQIFMMGWLADFPDPENFLFLYYGPNEAPGPNNTNYKNEEFDKLYKKAKSMPAGPERIELARRMEQMIVNDVPNVFLYHPIGFALRYDWLKNYKLPVWATGTYKYQKVDMDLRRERVGR